MHRFKLPNSDLAWAFSDESGKPVVQLHGLTSSRSRDRVLDLDLGRALSGTQLLRYDARGHGHSSGRAVPEDYIWSALAEDLLRLLDYWFPGEQVHGVGPSMGTATLLHAAVREPDRFSGLTLLIPPTAWETRPAQAALYLQHADLIENRGLDHFVAEGRRVPRPPATVGHPDTVPHVREDLLPSIYRGAAQSDLPAKESVAEVAARTTILAWVGDPGHPLSTAEELHELMPHSRLLVAHQPQDVRLWPGELARDVAAYDS